MLEGTAGDGRRAGRLRARRRRRATPDLVLIGTGSEVARRASRPPSCSPPRASRARVVSLPCWELFAGAGRRRTRTRCCPPEVPTLAVEAGAIVRLGPLGRRHASASTASAPRRPATGVLGRARLHPRARRRAGPAAAPTTSRRTDVTDAPGCTTCTSTGQSPWLDNLRRGWHHRRRARSAGSSAASGASPRTRRSSRRRSSAGADYDEQFGELIGGGTSVDDAYWDLVTDDIEDALAHPAPGLRRAATASTASCRSRSRPTSPATPTAPIAAPATCTSASPSPTST